MNAIIHGKYKTSNKCNIKFIQIAIFKQIALY